MKSASCFPESSSNESYYMVVFGSQTNPNWPQFSHTFATFAKASANGGSLADHLVHSHTISWLPNTLNIAVLRRAPEPGINLDLRSTLSWALCLDARIFQWGPFQIKQELYERALRQVTRLRSGSMKYKAMDGSFRPGTATNCTHAVSDLDMDHGMLNTGVKCGERASFLVTRHLLPWIIEPSTTHEWVSERLGLRSFPIIYRELDLESLDPKMRQDQRLLVGMHSLMRTSCSCFRRPMLFLKNTFRRQGTFDNAKTISFSACLSYGAGSIRSVTTRGLQSRPADCKSLLGGPP